MVSIQFILLIHCEEVSGNRYPLNSLFHPENCVLTLSNFSILSYVYNWLKVLSFFLIYLRTNMLANSESLSRVH